MRRVLIEIPEGTANFLCLHFGSKDLSKIIRLLLDEAGFIHGLVLTGFNDIKVREILTPNEK